VTFLEVLHSAIRLELILFINLLLSGRLLALSGHLLGLSGRLLALGGLLLGLRVSAGGGGGRLLRSGGSLSLGLLLLDFLRLLVGLLGRRALLGLGLFLNLVFRLSFGLLVSVGLVRLEVRVGLRSFGGGLAAVDGNIDSDLNVS
jgi:hypothetical protein